MLWSFASSIPALVVAAIVISLTLFLFLPSLVAALRGDRRFTRIALINARYVHSYEVWRELLASDGPRDAAIDTRASRLGPRDALLGALYAAIVFGSAVALLWWLPTSGR